MGIRRRALLAGAVAAPVVPMVAAAPATQAAVTPQASWVLKWSPQAATAGLGAFEGVEDDRANSHPAGQPHILVQGDNYRFNMHTVDRDSSTDRQRQEVKGMRAGGAQITMLKGQTWRFTYSMFIPTTLRATSTFTHIMQLKMPGEGSGPIMVMSLRRSGSSNRIELRSFTSNVTVGATDLAPLQNKWIDTEVEVKIGDTSTGSLRWVLRNGGTTVVDASRSRVDTWLSDRVRPKWGIYRSLGDKSGAIQNCYLLLTSMRAYQLQ